MTRTKTPSAQAMQAMRVIELRKAVAKAGLTGYSKATRDELLTALRSVRYSIPATEKKAAKKAPAAKKVVAPVEKLSTDSDEIPADEAQLRQLIKITRDRRWRAGRRGDEQLVAEMDARLVKLLAAARGEKVTPAKKATQARKTQAAKKAAPAKKANGNGRNGNNGR